MRVGEGRTCHASCGRSSVLPLWGGGGTDLGRGDSSFLTIEPYESGETRGQPGTVDAADRWNDTRGTSHDAGLLDERRVDGELDLASVPLSSAFTQRATGGETTAPLRSTQFTKRSLLLRNEFDAVPHAKVRVRIAGREGDRLGATATVLIEGQRRRPGEAAETKARFESVVRFGEGSDGGAEGEKVVVVWRFLLREG